MVYGSVGNPLTGTLRFCSQAKFFARWAESPLRTSKMGLISARGPTPPQPLPPPQDRRGHCVS
jgi:hypothetical protein